MPTGWLDVPRLVTDVPESVSALLDPPSGRLASSQQEPLAAITPEKAVAGKSGNRKATTTSDRRALSSEAKQDKVTTVTEQVVEQQNQARAARSDLAIPQPADNDAPTPASQPQPAPASFTEIVAEPRRSAPVTSLDDLVGIAPIAEALIKTLAGKARTGRLDEVKALALLQQIVTL
ncbi:hypothetical protein [Paraburkholderia fungorum]|uniref:hypothetical protein n=1 Tax=Paraburkholderia fungorum TaxID=134537 RepID=UPI000945D9D8|nr:hypothetical protein [Paraburkholderia fungorum]